MVNHLTTEGKDAYYDFLVQSLSLMTPIVLPGTFDKEQTCK